VNTSSNSIQKLILDLQVRVDKSNNEIFEKFSSIASFHAIPTIGNYFDYIIPKDVVIEIDHLEINLGLIKYEDLERVFKERLLEALKNIFGKYFDDDGNYRNQSNNFFNVKNLPDNQLAFVKYYLLFGRAPWWANDASINFNDSILQVINNSPSEFRKLLYEIGRDDSVRKRLAFSLSEAIIKKVIHVLEPSQSEYIFQYHSTVTKLNRAKQTVKTEEKVFKRSLWYVILTYIIYNRGGVFNRREFLKQNLYNVSTLYNVKYSELISLLYKGLKENQTDKKLSILSSLFDDIFYLSQELKIIEINQKPTAKKFEKNKLTNEDGFEEQLAVLHYYLERGSFSDTLFHYSRNDVVSMLDFFLNYHSELFIRYLKSANLNNQMIDRLFNLLPVPQFNKLINFITPTNLGIKIVDFQKSIILFLINSKLSTQIIINDDFKKSILTFIIKNNYSITFPELIKIFITRLSNNFQIAYLETLSIYQKDLKRQIHIQEFNLYVLQKISDQIEILSQNFELPVSVENNIKEEKDNNYYGIADLLKFVIVRGYIPWWGKDYLSKSLDKLMMDLFLINPREAFAIFNFASSQMLFRNRFIQFFSKDVTLAFLKKLWKNQDDWIFYDSLDSLLNSLPLNFNQPSDEAKSNILLHSFWKILIDGNFSNFNKNKFIHLNFLLLKKYHSFNVNELLTFIASSNNGSSENNLSKLNENFLEIVSALSSYSFESNEEEIIYDSSISIEIWFDLIINSIIFGNKKLTKSRKIKEIETVLNYYIKNLALPSYLLDYVKDKQSIFFSFLLDYFYLLDRNKFVQLIGDNIDSNNTPNWLRVILVESQNKYNLIGSNLILSPINLILDFDTILLKEVYKISNLTIKLKIKEVSELLINFLENLSFPSNISRYINNNENELFLYLLSILHSLDNQSHQSLLNKYADNTKFPEWLLSIFKSKKTDNLNIKNDQYFNFDEIVKFVILENKDISSDFSLIQIDRIIVYFIDHLYFPENFPDYIKNNQNSFFTFLLVKLNSLSPERFKEIIDNSLFTSKPIWFQNIITNTIQDLNIDNINFLKQNTNELTAFNLFLNDQFISLTSSIQIEKYILYFIDNLSFPANFPEYIKNKQNSFFIFLLEKLYSLSKQRFKEIVDSVLFSSKPIWVENLIKKAIKDLNINSINFVQNISNNESSSGLFENDDIFITTLLGFKPSSKLTHPSDNISTESFNLLVYILSNNKLPNKFESLNRYDLTFLITILLRYIYVNNTQLFNQFLLKFSSFPDTSRLILFKFFSGKSNHPIDLSISERLIPFMNGEIELQNKKIENIIKSDKISINVTNKLNEWINSESSIATLNRDEKLFQLLSYYLATGKLYDSFSSLSGTYLYEFLRILILEIEKIDSQKLLQILSNEKNDQITNNLVLNLFFKGDSIDERRVHSLFQSVTPRIPLLNLNIDDYHEFDFQFIDPTLQKIPLNDLDFKELLATFNNHEKITDQLLLDNSISILTYFLVHKKREPHYKKISDNQFLIYLKEIIGFIFSKKSTTIRELIENINYPLPNKLAVFSLFYQTYDSKEYAIKIFLQPIIESQIFNHVESIVKFPVSTNNFKDAVNTLIKSKLTNENINVLKLLQFIQSADLIDEITQLSLTDLVSKNMGNTHSAYLKQILSLFNSSLSNLQDRNELSNLFVRFNSYILSELKTLVNLDIYLRRLIQFLLFQNRSRALYFFGKFMYFTNEINFNFSSEYFFIINKLRKLFNELVVASDIANTSDSQIKVRDKPLLDKINEVISEFKASESSKVEEQEDLTIPTEDYKDTDESIYINNAGLVLFNPYITTFLSKLGMTEKGKFKDEESAFRSVHLLQLLVSEASYEEHELVLNKILCNLPVSSAIPMDIEIKPAEKQLAKELIEVTMKRWKKGSSGSKESFRASFINRDGRLSMINEEWHLKVDQRGYDVILQTLPWSYGMIKLPWMLKPLLVEWI
jgi:hypothetical protein